MEPLEDAQDLLDDGPVGPTLIVGLSSGGLLVSGLLSFLAGLMLQLGSSHYGVWVVGPWVMMVAGVLLLPVAGWFGRARDWAAVGSTLVGLFLLLFHGVWLLRGLLGHVVATWASWFHAWQLLAALSILIACCLLPFGVRDAFRASRNRRKLLE